VFPFLYAFVPAAVLLVLRIYFKAHPPDSSEAGVKGLQRGLKIGVVSALVLPLAYALAFYFEFRFGELRSSPGMRLILLVCALAGNSFNALGIRDCVRELSGESIVSGLLLAPIQLLWMWYLFSVLMMSN
jgi:hypothetical protein